MTLSIMQEIAIPSIMMLSIMQEIAILSIMMLNITTLIIMKLSITITKCPTYYYSF
jgi:hypothetical protein